MAARRRPKQAKRIARRSSRTRKAVAPAQSRPGVEAKRSLEPIDLKDDAVQDALRSGENSGLLEDYFGAPQYAELKRLSQEASLRGVRGGERVLILPGIMGSKLGYSSSSIFGGCR
jgi:hypothetical protein